MKILKRIHTFLLWYFALSTPLSFALWVLLLNPSPTFEIPDWMMNTLGYFVLGWFFSLVYVLGAFFFMRRFRQAILCRLAGLKERDERDSFITNMAARKTFLFMLAVLLVALLLSVINVHVKTETSESRGLIEVGVGADLSLDRFVEITTSKDGTHYHFALLPNSFAPLLVLLGVLQIFVFRRHSRETRKDE